MYNVVVMRHAIMGRIQMTIDHSTDDLLIAGKGQVVTGPVIGVDMGCSNAYKIVNSSSLLPSEGL